MLARLRKGRDGTIAGCVRSFYGATFSLSPEEALLVARREADSATQSVALQQQETGCWSSSTRVETRPATSYDEVRRGHRPMRVLFASSDFGAHTVGSLIYRVLERLNSSRVDFGGVAFSADDGTIFRRVAQAALKPFTKILPSANDRVAFDALSNADVLVDLNGFSKGGRYASIAARPATVTAAYLGFPSSTGSAHDVAITDRVATPVDIASKFYSEPLLLFSSSSYFATSHAATYELNREEKGHYWMEPDISGDLLTAEERENFERVLRAKRDGRVVYSNFGQLYKITPTILRVWCNILKRVPRSVLWMVKHDSISDRAIERLRSEMAMRSVHQHRLIVTSMFSQAVHCRVKRHLADVSLDTFPYAGHSTAADVLWSSVPHVTLAGDMTPSRVATSLLASLDMDILLSTTSLRDYEDVSVRMGINRTLRLALRRRLYESARHSPRSAFDIDRKASEIGQATKLMWEVAQFRRTDAVGTSTTQNYLDCTRAKRQARLANVVVVSGDTKDATRSA
eukprot:g5534.t1